MRIASTSYPFQFLSEDSKQILIDFFQLRTWPADKSFAINHSDLVLIDRFCNHYRSSLRGEKNSLEFVKGSFEIPHDTYSLSYDVAERINRVHRELTEKIMHLVPHFALEDISHSYFVTFTPLDELDVTFSGTEYTRLSGQKIKLNVKQIRKDFMYIKYGNYPEMRCSFDSELQGIENYRYFPNKKPEFKFTKFKDSYMRTVFNYFETPAMVVFKEIFIAATAFAAIFNISHEDIILTELPTKSLEKEA